MYSIKKSNYFFTDLFDFKCVWKRDTNRIFKKFKFFLLKFNMVCMFWIVLMC
jgi:hypothetical protein